MTQCIENGYYQLFDQNIIFDTEAKIAQQAREIGETILQISQLTIDFASIYRVPRYCENRQESDVEHSFMLALAGIEVAPRYYPGFDVGLVGQLALIHDFPELKTGDVATFDITEAQLQEKHANEQAGLVELLAELPPHLADLLAVYEEQQLPEAIFVKHLDKLLPNAVNITGAGIAVMNEDYNVHTATQFLEKNDKLEQRFHATFTNSTHQPLHRAHSFLANKFALTFSEV